MSYLLVAILPGEVQEAGGEQLIFSPGITVHGVRASRLGWRSLRSFSAANGRPSFIRLPPTSVSFSARLSVPLASPSGAVDAIKRAAAVFLAAASPVT